MTPPRVQRFAQKFRRLRREVRHLPDRLKDSFKINQIDHGYCSRNYSGWKVEESLEIMREQFKRLVVPESRSSLSPNLRHNLLLRSQELLTTADDICKHKISIFGTTYDLGDELNWHKDPVSGYIWPLCHRTKINFWDVTGTTDIRVIWELSSFRHGVVLGQGYWLSSDEQYADEFIRQVQHWIKANPVNYGANWKCPMMTAIRAVNLAWSYALFSGCQLLSPSFQLLFLNLMRIHALHIFSHLENKTSIRGNHYIANLVGLLYISCLCPMISQSKKWYAFAQKELAAEVCSQVLPDGINFEASIPYHHFVTEMLLHAAIVPVRVGAPGVPRKSPDATNSMRQRGSEILGESLLTMLEAMCDFIWHYTKPDDRAPQIGDNDNSRLVVLGSKNGRQNDHRYLLSCAGELFDRDDFRLAGLGAKEEAFWLLQVQPKSSINFFEASAPNSKCFPHGGVCIMRSAKDFKIVRCGSLGTGGKGTHTHNDNLAFELCVGGVTYLVDPGTFTYLGDPEWRRRFRSTSYHNTLQIDGREQNDICPKDPFRLWAGSEARILKWISNQNEDIFLGELRYLGGEHIIHRRQIKFIKSLRRWIVVDEVLGSGLHSLDWFFHVSHCIGITLGTREILLNNHHGGGSIRLTGELIELGRLEKLRSWYSPEYGRRVESQVIRISYEGTLPVKRQLILEPGKANSVAV